jgi:F5/8 type C domain
MALKRACSFALWAAACSFPDYGFSPAEPSLSSICTDQIPSSRETGLDCGGVCPPCPAGEACREDADCSSERCLEAVCQAPRCGDGLRNGSETDTDCGGTCPPCEVSQLCLTPQDCQSGVCSGACQEPTCDDGVKNRDEPASDCGGDFCVVRCPAGRPCATNSDCESNRCPEGYCVSLGCTDNIPSGLETGVDCGGPECGPCPGGQGCSDNDDCESVICTPALVCTQSSCSDGVKNGGEIDPDCGGPCPGCAVGTICSEAAACATNLCQSSLCVPATATGVGLSRTGWLPSASNTFDDSLVTNVFDDSNSRWTSGTPQVPGLWFQVDMLGPQIFFAIEIDVNEVPLDAPEAFDVYLSLDGQFTEPARTGVFGSTLTRIQFDNAQVARYVRFELTAEKSRWWSISEIGVFR